MPVPDGLSLSGATIRLGPALPVPGLAEGIEKVSLRLSNRPAGHKTWDWADVLATAGPRGFSR